MILCNPVVPTLQQMSVLVIAVKVCNDPEVKAFMKIYGPVSFVIPSKELHTFLNKELPVRTDRMMYKLHFNEIKFGFVANSPTSAYLRGFDTSVYKFHSTKNGFTADDLPSITWEEIVSRKISSLGIPNIMRSELISIIRCICIEIDRWHKDHKDIFHFDFIDFQRYFCWSSQGKIDRAKTAQSLIKNETLRISERYNFARHYCFENDVKFLWKKLKEGDKIYFSSIGDYGVWFKYIATKTDINEIRISRNSRGNPFNMKAYFSLLTPIEKKLWLKSFINCKAINYEDVHFCLSFLEKNEQEDIWRQYSSKILQYYLVWPLQNEFLSVLKNIWPYMSIENYIDILHFIIYERIMIGWNDFDYVGLMKEFWRQTPNNLKELVKRYEIYQVALPVINCELFKRYPNEVILENYKDHVLKFHHVGINYCLLRRPVKMDHATCTKRENNFKARLNLTPLNGSKPWIPRDQRKYRRCGQWDETLPHVLNHCTLYSTAWQIRHNTIQRRIKTTVQYKGTILSDNQVIGSLDPRPDKVATIGNKLYIIDITVPFENRRGSFRSAAERKLEKYTPLIRHFNSLGYEDVQIVPIIVGSLGSGDSNNDAFLRLVATRSCLKNLKKLCVFDAIKWSRDIYLQHLTGKKQYGNCPAPLAPTVSPNSPLEGETV
ncbi:uncharacterized protein TNCV_5025651 [Trichonephila clavipes]|nr:uncharacterized protein TNCV_5025651 [Trichonephila clavipes]